MGRAKIPRKSTNIDMTAMCDVAFLLLSFFILATKQKPPEAVTVTPPTSVSSEAAEVKSILLTLTKEGKAILMLGDDTKKNEVLAKINTNKGLNLSPAELAKLAKQPFIAVPFSQIKSLLALDAPLAPDKIPGIPIDDTSKNELVDWYASIKQAYSDVKQADLDKILLIKGDNDALYPQFKNVKFALKKNSLFKFKVVTNSEGAPVDSELYKYNKANPKKN
jgi:biopolymer transport protein ExbD